MVRMRHAVATAMPDTPGMTADALPGPRQRDPLVIAFWAFAWGVALAVVLVGGPYGAGGIFWTLVIGAAAGAFMLACVAVVLPPKWRDRSRYGWLVRRAQVPFLVLCAIIAVFTFGWSLVGASSTPQLLLALPVLIAAASAGALSARWRHVAWAAMVVALLTFAAVLGLSWLDMMQCPDCASGDYTLRFMFVIQAGAFTIGAAAVMATTAAGAGLARLVSRLRSTSD